MRLDDFYMIGMDFDRKENQGIGKTHTNATFAHKIGANYITTSVREAKRVSQQYQVHAYSMPSVVNGSLRGDRSPTVYDPECISMVISNIGKANDILLKRVEELEALLYSIEQVKPSYRIKKD